MPLYICQTQDKGWLVIACAALPTTPHSSLQMRLSGSLCTSSTFVGLSACRLLCRALKVWRCNRICISHFQRETFMAWCWGGYVDGSTEGEEYKGLWDKVNTLSVISCTVSLRFCLSSTPSPYQLTTRLLTFSLGKLTVCVYVGRICSYWVLVIVG